MQKGVRSLHSYLGIKLAIRSRSVRDLSKTALDNFSIFLKEFHQTTPDKIISDFKDQELAFDVLQAWVNWHTTTKSSFGKIPSARTTRLYFNAIKRYLHYMGVKFHPEDIKQEINLPQILEREKYGVKREEIKLIIESFNRFRKRALYLAQVSSGMRIGELVQLRKKHLDLTTKRIKVKIPAEFTKLKRARTTFFSSEFSKMYLSKIRQLDDNDLLFVDNENWEHARDNEIQNVEYACKKTGLKNITSHSFRAYFITKVSRLDYNLAKLFAGQKGYLLQYDRLDDDEKLEKYIEFEPELLVYETANKNNKLEENIGRLYDVLHKLTTDDTEEIDGDELRKTIESFKQYSKKK